MDQVWKGLSNLDPRDPGGFYKKPLLIHVDYLLDYRKLLGQNLRHNSQFL